MAKNYHSAISKSNCLGDIVRVRGINLDKTPSALTCPLDMEILAMELTGTPSGNIAIQFFLAGAVATDNLDITVPVTHNAPDFFPMGNTVVTFTAMDDAGNQGVCHATITFKYPPPVFEPVAGQTVNERPGNEYSLYGCGVIAITVIRFWPAP